LLSGSFCPDRSMFDQELDTAIKLLAHLDKRACWDQHKQERIGRLHSIAERCLEGMSLHRRDICGASHAPPRACGAHP
jgi:hypothetical protein